MGPELWLVLVALALFLGGGVARTWPEKSSPPDLGPYTYRYDPDWLREPEPEPEPEPWRLGPYGAVAVLVGVDMLVELADPRRLQMLAHVENDRCLELQADIKDHGIREPLLLIVDSMGRVCMKEGHHRTIVASRIGLRSLPVRFGASEGRVAYGRPLSGLLDRFLQSVVREALVRVEK